MTKDYLQMFNRFFKKSRMSSTYKPIFLRALLDVGDINGSKGADVVGINWLERKDGKIIMDLDFIAVRFAKYYWDMQYSFKLRQSQSPQDASITRIISKIHNERKKPPPTFKEIATDDMSEFRQDVIRTSIKPQVLRYLLTDMKGLYEKTGSNTIVFDEDLVDFLHHNKLIIQKGLTCVLAKYLEKINHMTPQIANKIEFDYKKRTQLDKVIQSEMLGWQDSRCFYCDNRLTRPHIDHIIPFNYVFSTDAYNCAAACQQCNCKKSDKLPTKQIFFGDVLERNESISSYLEKLNLKYDKKSYMRMYENCAQEYNGMRQEDFFRP